MAASDDASLEDLVRQPLVVPIQVGVNELLRLMRARRVHFAVAVDEYGGTDGIVTLEDVLEEIVGELEDEFEQPHSPAPVARGAVRLDGLDSVDVLDERIGLTVAEGPVQDGRRLRAGQSRADPPRRRLRGDRRPPVDGGRDGGAADRGAGGAPDGAGAPG